MNTSTIFQKLKENWSSPIVARHEVAKFSGGLLNPRSMANLDSLKQGCPGKITVGRRVAYPVDALIEWMQERAA